MSVLKLLFDKSVNQSSPIQVDMVRKVNYDADGNEFITYEPFDYPKYQESLGTVDQWSLNSLLKAGVDPNFPIHTGLGTRIEGFNTVTGMISELDSIMPENTDSNSNSKDE